MPSTPTNQSSEEDWKYFNCVEQNMIHVCSNAVNGCLDKKGNCKRGYRSREAMESTTLDHNGYPIYRRPNRDDLKVVPHNREVLLDWDGILMSNMQEPAIQFCTYINICSKEIRK